MHNWKNPGLFEISTLRGPRVVEKSFHLGVAFRKCPGLDRMEKRVHIAVQEQIGFVFSLRTDRNRDAIRKDVFLL